MTRAESTKTPWSDMSIARNRRALAAAATAAALAAASLIAISPAHADDPGLAGAD